MVSGARRISTRRKLLYTSLLSLALLAVCEAGLRFRQWLRYGSAATAVRDPMLVYDPAADLYVPRAGYEVKGARINIKINSLGFRGDEIDLPKPPNTIRIVCLGASTTFSAEVSSNAATWPSRLQEKLAKAYPNVNIDVINAAVPGYVVSDNLKNLRRRVMSLAPDLVIYYEANNEIVRDTRDVALREGVIMGSGRSSFVSVLSKYSLLFDLGYKNLAILARSRAASERRIDRVPPNLPERFVGVLDEMRTELARNDVPLVLSTFLVKYRRNQDRPTQIANADVAFYYMPWMSIDGMLDAVDVYNQAILSYAQRSGLLVVDDREAVPADADHYVDCMHFADKGAEAMADRFYRAMRTATVIDQLISKAKNHKSN